MILMLFFFCICEYLCCSLALKHLSPLTDGPQESGEELFYGFFFFLQRLSFFSQTCSLHERCEQQWKCSSELKLLCDAVWTYQEVKPLSSSGEPHRKVLPPSVCAGLRPEIVCEKARKKEIFIFIYLFTILLFLSLGDMWYVVFLFRKLGKKSK